MVQYPWVSMSSVASIVPIGPVRAAAMACAPSSMLGWAAPWGPSVAKFCATKPLSPVFIRYTAHGTA